MGEWKLYYESGNLSWIGVMNDTFPEGEYKSYYDNGQLKNIWRRY